MSKIAEKLRELQVKIGTDKVAHFATCYLLNDQLHRYTGLSCFETVLIVSAIGLLKEVLVDSKFDRGDLIADVLGALFYEVTF